MNIGTHFSIGQIVWLKHEGELCCGSVERINVVVSRVNDSLDYILQSRYKVKIDGNILDRALKPTEIFQTKIELTENIINIKFESENGTGIKKTI